MSYIILNRQRRRAT